MTTEDRITQFKKFMPIHTRIDLETLKEIGFFTAPASTRFHGAYRRTFRSFFFDR